MTLFAHLNVEIDNCISSHQITPSTEIQEKTVLVVLERRSWIVCCIDYSTI